MLGEDDAPVHPAGAADADGEVALPLALVFRDDVTEEGEGPVEELARLGEAEHEVAHALVGPREALQLGTK